MLKMTKPDHDPIQIGTEHLGDGVWRSCVFDQDGHVLEVLGSAGSAAAASGYALSYIVQKDLQGWRAQFRDE